MTLTFDAMASQFDDQRGLPRAAISAWLRCVDELAAGRQLHVIEPGIGTGRIALPLAIAGHVVAGVDISPPMLDVCRQRAETLGVADLVDAIWGDAADLPYAEHSFDLGVIAQLLYLVPDWTTVLDELARVVSPGGYVIHLTEPTIESDALQLWSSTWWQMVAETGYQQLEVKPGEDDIAAEFLRRWPDVQVQELASWEFGQTVAEARRDYGRRVRVVYPDMAQEVWDALVDRYLAWSESAFPDSSTMLSGRVVLTARIAAS
ncbi:MAG: class I SAM-dependent methyltransferase [Thermomicrobiales bacterium]|nr:class I SAM-dependent methyltransferase [Thermomicrobiales bacterium]